MSARKRYAASGIAGLDDAPHPGGPVTVLTREVTEQILADTLTPPPEALQARGVTQWSARRLADWLARHRGIEVSHDRIAEVWKRFSLKPHRSEGFKFSTDPELETKIRDVVGLYLDPPKGAVVVCVDEKGQIQAPGSSRPRTAPPRPRAGSGRAPTTSKTFSVNNGSLDSLNPSVRWGLRSNAFQIRPIVDGLSPLRWAIFTRDQ